MKQNKLPKWFNGTIYDKGDLVTNPFSGESYELNNLELSMYDFVMGAQMTFAVHQEKQPNKPISEKLIKDFERVCAIARHPQLRPAWPTLLIKPGSTYSAPCTTTRLL